MKSAFFTVFKWPGPYEIQPSKSPDFNCFPILNGHISDPHYTSIESSAFKSFRRR